MEKKYIYISNTYPLQRPYFMVLFPDDALLHLTTKNAEPLLGAIAQSASRSMTCRGWAKKKLANHRYAQYGGFHKWW